MPKENVIRIMCPNLGCQRILAVPGHARGKLVRCRSCGMTVRVPLAKSESRPPAPGPAPGDASSPAGPTDGSA